MKSINYTTDLWNYYSKPQKRTDGLSTWYVENTAEIIYESDGEGNEYRSMIHVNEKLRSPWVVAWTAALGPQKQAFNEVLDLHEGERISAAGQATGS